MQRHYNTVAILAFIGDQAAASDDARKRAADHKGRLGILNKTAITGMATAAALLCLNAFPLAAQSDGLDADRAIDRAKQYYGPPPPRTQCNEEGSEEEIVVCAEEAQDDAEFRVQSTSDLDPESREALDDGLPRAPDVAGAGIFQGKGISLGGTPDPAYMFDLSELPETPEGSDADLIGKGEKKLD